MFQGSYQSLPNVRLYLQKKHVFNFDLEQVKGSMPPLVKTDDALMGRTSGKIGRNAPCPCGSDKKHKRCCGLP